MRPLAALLLVLLTACTAAPRSPTPAPAARAAPAATATPDAAASALALVPLRIQESPLPPAEPTPPGFTSGRATATPFATPEAAWKYVTLTLAVENRSAEARLVGIAGSDPATTNLAQATLTTRDGTRYKPIRSNSSLGMRTATSHALVTYPVLLRLPPSFRVSAESAGSLSVVAPDALSLTFKVPSELTDYGVLTVPPPSSLSSKTAEDDITRGMRSNLGGFAPLDLAGGARSVVFPLDGAPAGGLSVGAPASSAPNHVTATLLGVEAADPEDFEIRNRGWKQLTFNLSYHNDDAQQPHAFNVAAWLFGDDGIVYTGDAPTVADFGRALVAPDPSAILLWDGRSAGTDLTPPSQALEPRRATFFVPRGLRNGMLVLAGDLDAVYALSELPSP
jgi:hypothetical protein